MDGLASPSPSHRDCTIVSRIFESDAYMRRVLHSARELYEPRRFNQNSAGTGFPMPDYTCDQSWITKFKLNMFNVGQRQSLALALNFLIMISLESKNANYTYRRLGPASTGRSRTDSEFMTIRVTDSDKYSINRLATTNSKIMETRTWR